jgi:hypothetical protein
VNPINSGDGILFRRIDLPNSLCVLVSAFVLAGGQVQGDITAYALPTDAAGCLVASPTGHVMATTVTGTIVSPDGGLHCDIDLQVTFSALMDWLAPAVHFKTSGLRPDGVWYPAS